MLSLQTNGFTAQTVADALLGKNGVIERRWRFDIHTRDGAFLRRTYSVREGGGIRYEENKSIRRTGSMQIEARSFTLVDDYFDYNSEDNFDLEMPTLYSMIVHESAIGYWRLGESSGTSAADSSGNGRTGTYTGGVTLNDRGLCEAALTNGSALFDGTNDYVVISDHASFDVSNLSVECWIKTSYVGARQIIVSRDDLSTNRQFILRTLATSDTGLVGYLELVLFFSGATTVRYTAPINVCDGIPHHCEATYNGVSVDLYVDGVRVLHTLETRSMLLVNASLYIGALNGAGNHFHGNIDEVALYGYGLAAPPIRGRFQAGSGQLYEIDFSRDQIKAYCAIKMLTAGDDGTFWAEFPRGLFSFIVPDVDEEVTGSDFSVILQDMTARLENTTFRSTNYTIAITKKYREALTDLFTYAGFASGEYSIATTTVSETTLPVSKEYPIGTTVLFAMNELLKEMNYRQASADSNGVIKLDAWVSSGSRATEFTLNTDSNSIISASLKKKTNMKEAFNEVFLKKPGSKGVQEYIGRAQITSASHPLHPSRLGYYKTYNDTAVVAASQTVIDEKAVKTLEEKARISYALELGLPLICALDNDDLLRIIGVDPPPLFSAAFFNVPDKFLVTSWEEPIDDAGECKVVAEFYLQAA